MSPLDFEVVELRRRINEIASRLDVDRRMELDTAAESFLRSEHTIREGDCVRFSDGHAACIRNISSEGKWTYTDRNGRHIEPFRVPPEQGIERLYTIAEVAEIIAKARAL